MKTTSSHPARFDFQTACEAMLRRLGATEGRWRELSLPTVAGPLECSVYEDWLACAFDDVKAARAKVGHGSLNPFSGKWNWMYDKPGPDELLHLYDQIARVVVPSGEVAELVRAYAGDLQRLDSRADINTRLSYMYRDADNYKVGGEAVFQGRFRLGEDLLPLLMSLARSEGAPSLIPGQVGLPDLQDSFQGCESRWDPERDHPWHEVTGIEPVLAESTPPTQDRSVFEFSRDVIRVGLGGGWDESYRPPFYELMQARQSRHEREGT